MHKTNLAPVKYLTGKKSSEIQRACQSSQERNPVVDERAEHATIRWTLDLLPWMPVLL
jgi:hypothetical protein